MQKFSKSSNLQVWIRRQEQRPIIRINKLLVHLEYLGPWRIKWNLVLSNKMSRKTALHSGIRSTIFHCNRSSKTAYLSQPTLVRGRPLCWRLLTRGLTSRSSPLAVAHKCPNSSSHLSSNRLIIFLLQVLSLIRSQSLQLHCVPHNQPSQHRLLTDTSKLSWAAYLVRSSLWAWSLKPPFSSPSSLSFQCQIPRRRSCLSQRRCHHHNNSWAILSNSNNRTGHSQLPFQIVQ